MKFRKFTKPQFLKSIGKDWLGKLFQKLSSDSPTPIAFPDAALAEDEFFRQLSDIVSSPDGLPDEIIEMLFAIEEMANTVGQERLEKAAAEAGLDLKFDEKSTHGEIALQVFLADPALLVETHNDLKLGRLATFEYFGSAPDGPSGCMPHGPAGAVDRTPSYTPPTPEVLVLLTSDLDEWFKAHNRGNKTAQIEMKVMDAEFWFVVRHGDTYARAPKVEDGKWSVVHFRPAKDDVIVYSPKRNEIRIHAGTKGERELYRRKFGERLFGDPEYFCERKAYTLEPLRSDDSNSLSVADISGIQRIVLREYEVSWNDKHHNADIKKSDDIYAAALERAQSAFPDGGTIQQAKLDFYFQGQKKPRRVQIKIPNTLKLGRHCDARLVHDWISARGFRANESSIASADAELNPAVTTI